MSSTDASPILDEPISTALPQGAHVTTMASVAGCDVCAHPLDEHDRIARRYCTATVTNAIIRGCICG